MFDQRTKQGGVRPRKRFGNFISASNYKKRCEKLKREQPMTGDEIADIKKSGVMLIEAAETEKKKLPDNMYQMYVHIGQMLINCSGHIKGLQDRLEDATNVIKEFKAMTEKLKKDLKLKDIEDIKSEGKISHEDRI